MGPDDKNPAVRHMLSHSRGSSELLRSRPTNRFVGPDRSRGVALRGAPPSSDEHDTIAGPLNKKRSRVTSLVCWIAVDSRAIASVYIASDSRITYTDGREPYDTACKVFACRRRPDILGYCGNAGKPPTVLAGLASALDARPLVAEENAWDRARLLVDGLTEALPLDRDHPYDQTKVIYASRDGSGHANAAFAVFEISVIDGRWYFQTLINSAARTEDEDEDERYRALRKLDVVFADGSGASDVRRWRERWVKYHESEIARHKLRGTTRTRTSRGVFSALCTALRFGADPCSGGAPQLAVIHQEGAAMPLGVIWGARRFYEGMPRTGSDAIALNTRWYDKLFQQCDPNTMQVLEEAAFHSAPVRGLDPERPPEAPSKRKRRRQDAAARTLVEKERARTTHRKRFLK